MPFADESGPVELVASRACWADEFEAIAEELRRVDAPGVIAIDHIGSTSVPGLVAKDVIDVQVRVADLERGPVVERFAMLGLRLRPEEWNQTELTRTGPEDKLVFSSPVGVRRANLNVRRGDGKGAYDNLLFRDFLRASPAMREMWGDFKRSLVGPDRAMDLIGYGQLKQPAWATLMRSADRWASEHGWSPDEMGT